MTRSDLENYFFNQLPAFYTKEEGDAVYRLVFEKLFNENKTAAVLSNDLEVSNSHFDSCKRILSRLAENEPIQYILGNAWFCGMNLKVDRNVLIPRPETEELVHLIFNDVKRKNLNFLDIGTGSGCIAIGLKKLMPNAAVTGVDISEKALAIARLNAIYQLLAVNFHQLDILNFQTHADFINSYEKFDVIVSNPPYIGMSEKKNMSLNVTAFEPEDALFVPDEDLLLFYRAIGDFSKQFLKQNGTLYFEINQSLGVQVVTLLTEQGFSAVEKLKDYSGNDRFVKAVLL